MINCEISSPEETRTYENLRSIVLPAQEGEMQVLPGHAEAFVSLQKGNIVLEEEDKKETISIAGGKCHIKDDRVLVIL